MNIPVNRLTSNFFASLNNRISRLRADGVDVIRLDIGSPDLPPAPHIIQALADSAKRSGNHGYQSHKATKAFREAWVKMYERVHGVDLDPEGVLPLLGSKEGVFHISTAILNPGDVVLVPDPGYQTYIQAARFAGANPQVLPLLPEMDYFPDFSAVSPQIANRTKLIWLNYPNNPTGAAAPLESFSRAVDFCQKHNILICHDAAYSQVTYDGYKAPSILEIPGAFEVAVEFNTLSKSHNMAGWRVGAAVGQPDALTSLFTIKTHADSGHFLPVTEAAVAAMTGDQSWLETRNKTYQERRDVLHSELIKMGFNTNKPLGSIFMWCPLPDGLEAETFVMELLENTHVSLAPGTVFGASWGKFIRISLCQPVDRIAEAMERMRNWLKGK